MDLLKKITRAGCTVTVDGEKLICSPASKLTQDLRNLIRDHKPELLVMVEARDDLANYLARDIQSGGPYARLWPQVQEYCRRELSKTQWTTLKAAYERISHGNND